MASETKANADDGEEFGEGRPANHDMRHNSEALRRLNYMGGDNAPSSTRIGQEVDVTFTDEDSGEEITLSVDHVKLLYLISRYARCALGPDQTESWIRQIPLLVLVYEGVIAGVLDYDYAPCSRLVSAEGQSQRIWINISQEGKAGIDDLREWKLINGLKLSTEDFQPVTAFQVSAKGLQLLRKTPKSMRKEVNSFIYKANPTKPSKNNLMQVSFIRGETGEDGVFMLTTPKGWSKESDITDMEDVSYVSSPYLPAIIRASETPATTDNSRRAAEAAAGTTTIRDELSVAVELDTVHAMVAEWIPFGANQIVALNERLGAMDRCQGGLFTAMVDKAPNDTKFEVPVGLTQVKILDFDVVRFINFEAEIMYPEEEGIVQVENFGMHLNVDGTIIYGVRVEAILESLANCVCVDHLARLLVDVHQDSSRIMNDLLSPYQRGLLDMVFSGDMMARNKYNLIVADGITPFLPAEEYMDRDERENELKQVLGDLYGSYDVSDRDRLLLGAEGALIVGPHSQRYEELLVSYLSLLAKDLMIKNFFTRTFVLDDELRQVRTLTQTYLDSPLKINKLREKLQQATRNVILLVEVLDYIRESLEEMKLPEPPADEVGGNLFRLLDLTTMHHDVLLRVKDMNKLLDGAQNKVHILQMMTTAIDKSTVEETVKSIDTQFNSLVSASAAEQRSSASLEVMNIIFSGSFAFDLIDRLSGDDFLGAVGVDDSRGLKWLNDGIKDSIAKWPFLWFFVNMMWLLLVSLALRTLMQHLVKAAEGAVSQSVVINRRIDREALGKFLESRTMDTADAVADTAQSLKKAAWYDEGVDVWRGKPPKISIFYDDGQCFLLTAIFQWNYKDTTVKTGKEMAEIFQDLLDKAGVFDVEEPEDDGTTAKIE